MSGFHFSIIAFTLAILPIFNGVHIQGNDLVIGGQATINTRGGETLRVRVQPGTSSPVLVEISKDTIVSIIDGPIAADNYNWWHIRTLDETVDGWSVESADGIQTLIPVTSQRLATYTQSPGDLIAYVNSDEDGHLLRIVNSDGTNLRVFPNDQIHVLALSNCIKFAPDGSTLAFVSSADGNNILRLLDLNNSSILPIANNVSSFAWSLNGEQIAYIPSNANEIWVRNFSLQTDTLVIQSEPNAQISRLSWSPDGEYFAYYRTDTDATFRFVIQKTDGSILFEHDAPQTFDWSPDGTRIVFVMSGSSVPETSILYTSNVDGSNLQKLYGDEFFAARFPKWSPDGRWIAFLRSSTTARDQATWLISPNAPDDAHPLPNGDFGRPEDWSPDSASIVLIGEGFSMWTTSLDGHSVGLGQAVCADWQPIRAIPQVDDIPIAALAQLPPGYAEIIRSVETLYEQRGEIYTTYDLAKGVAEIAQGTANKIETFCTLATSLNVLFPGNTSLEDAEYTCTWTELGIRTLAVAKSTATVASRTSVLLALVPVLLEPEKYVDPWLDPINDFAWSLPITCLLFPDFYLCDRE